MLKKIKPERLFGHSLNYSPHSTNEKIEAEDRVQIFQESERMFV